MERDSQIVDERRGRRVSITPAVCIPLALLLVGFANSALANVSYALFAHAGCYFSDEGISRSDGAPSGPLSGSTSESCNSHGGSANAAVGATVDIGTFRAQGTITRSGSTSDRTFSNANMSSSEQALLFSSPGRAGQTALVHASVAVDAQFRTSPGSGDMFSTFGRWAFAVQVPMSFSMEAVYRDDTLSGPDCASGCVFDFAFPVTLEDPISFQLAAGSDVYAPPIADGSQSASLGLLVYWNGIEQVTVDGVPIAFTLISESGHDWTRPSAPIPEPSAFTLLYIGLAGALAVRRLRRSGESSVGCSKVSAA
jgi:hypothetical protein